MQSNFLTRPLDIHKHCVGLITNFDPTDCEDLDYTQLGNQTVNTNRLRTCINIIHNSTIKEYHTVLNESDLLVCYTP